MKTIKDVLDQYPEEYFVNGGKARVICQIVATIAIKEQARKNYEDMLALTMQLEGRN